MLIEPRGLVNTGTQEDCSRPSTRTGLDRGSVPCVGGESGTRAPTSTAGGVPAHDHGVRVGPVGLRVVIGQVIAAPERSMRASAVSKPVCWRSAAAT